MSQHASFSCFVTGTDTEIGKTLVSSALLVGLVQRGFKAVGMKPVAAGTELRAGQRVNEDVACLRAAGNLHFPATLISPYLWDEAIAPHLAAEHAGVQMEAGPILRAFGQLSAQADAVVVEGVGGFCVPLSRSVSMADLAGDLALPVVLVVGLRLGCINHALLTAQAIAARGLSLIGWVANTVDQDMPYLPENIRTLRQALPAPLIGHIPRLGHPTPEEAAARLDFALLGV